MSSYQDESGLIPGEVRELTKSQRKNIRKKQRKQAQQAYTQCPAGHTVKTSTAVIKTKFDVDINPGDTAQINEEQCFTCQELSKHLRAKEERLRQQAEREDEELRATFLKEATREINRVEHLYRPDQGTKVVVHGVKFLWRHEDKSIVLGCASFNAKVIAVEISKDTEQLTFDTVVTVQLMSREDINFRDVKPCPASAFQATGGGLALDYLKGKNEKGQDRLWAITRLHNSQLDRHSEYVVLGTKCNPTRCDDDCARHTFRNTVVFYPSKAT